MTDAAFNPTNLSPNVNRGLDLIRDVDVSLTVELGRTRMALKDVLKLGEDSVVPLGRQVDELLDIYVNGKAIAKGEVITQGNRFALRIVELAGEASGPRSSAGTSAEAA